MNLKSWLVAAIHQLTAADDTTARLDALVLLEDCLGCDRALLLAHPETELTAEQLFDLERALDRRAAHEPLAYIRGKTEFYGRQFRITKNVLEPRPESETMIELLKKLVSDSDLTATKGLTIIDVGTGSGALAITAKLELPGAKVTAIDIDSTCVAVARGNAHTLDADVTFLEGDLLIPLQPQSLASHELGRILICNLPYVPDLFPINRAAGYEPRLALFGGNDGLDVYRKLFRQVSELTWPPKHIFTEAMPLQHAALRQIAVPHGYVLASSADFIQLFTKI